MLKRPIYVCLLCLILLLGGCTVRMAYYFLPTRILWSADQWVDFQPQQRQGLKVVIDEVLDWHRREELPLYGELLEDLARLVEQGRAGQPGQLEHFYQAGQQRWYALVDYTFPRSQALLLSLDERQIDELQESLEDWGSEYEEEWQELSLQQWQKRRAKHMRKHARRWLGRLQDQQSAAIEEWSLALQPLGALYVQQQQRWQRLLLETLRSASGEEVKGPILQQLFTRPSELWSDSYRRRIDTNRALTLALIGKLLNQASPRQRQRAANKLRGWAEDCRYLAGR